MKTLNIEMNVRRMEAQNILTTSITVGPNVNGHEEGDAPARQGGVAAPTGNGGAVPVRAGF